MALHVLLVEAVVEVVELLLEVEVVELPHVEAVVVKPSKKYSQKPAIYIVGFFYLIRL